MSEPYKGGAGCISLNTAHIPHLPNDSRFHERVQRSLGELFRCPVIACHMGPDANVYTVTVRAPDGRQRTVTGCVKHVLDLAGGALSAVRLEPFE